MAKLIAPAVRHYPPGDAEFRADVEAALTVEDYDLEAVLARLRTKYFAVRIAPRNPLANGGEGPLWYCYRDGNLIPSAETADAAV